MPAHSTPVLRSAHQWELSIRSCAVRYQYWYISSRQFVERTAKSPDIRAAFLNWPLSTIEVPNQWELSIVWTESFASGTFAVVLCDQWLIYILYKEKFRLTCVWNWWDYQKALWGRSQYLPFEIPCLGMIRSDSRLHRFWTWGFHQTLVDPSRQDNNKCLCVI